MLAVDRAQPALLCLLADEKGAARCWETMLDALDALSPLVDDVRAGHAYVDMHGAPGDARRWIAQARAIVASFSLPVRIGAGSNKFAAYAAARVADGAVCARGEERVFLAPLSLDLLDVDERLRQRLGLLGIATLGDLAALPHGPFVRRFGARAAGWHACARGEDRTPFLPRAHGIAIEASMFGEGRLEDEAQLFFALRMILSRVCADIERCGKSAGALELTLELEDGSEARIDVAIATPSAQERLLGDILRAKLRGSTFPCAIVGARLRATRLEEGGEPMPIVAADDVDPRSVAVAIARLQAVQASPQRARMRPAYALERRFFYEPFVVESSAPHSAGRDEEEEPADALVPQLRLHGVREIEVTLERGAPVSADGRRVVECVGPWRISEGWFSQTEIVRDEYDLLLDDARRVRVYHQGRHWYLRGAYD
ncbi:MAG: hypothetical protein ACREMP_01490 [Candidatus Tyrphobacter sp.]